MNETLLYAMSTAAKDAGEQPNVVVPYVNGDRWQFKAMRLNLVMDGIEARYVRLDDAIAADYEYARLFRQLWDEGDPFVIVEHDVIPWPGAIRNLWECDEPWCAYPYYVRGGLHAILGCVKFVPEALGPCPLPEGEAIHWTNVDEIAIPELSRRGFPGHQHHPAVSHLHFGQGLLTESGQYNPDLGG